MSLATFKRKTKQLRNVKIGYKQRLTKSNCCVNPGNSVETPNRSYHNIYRNRRVFNLKNNNGVCCSEIVKPVRDGSGQHRLERLVTQHLKEENVAKMKFEHKERLEGCREHCLNIIEDESGKTKSAEHVMNKKKACLIDESYRPTKINTKLLIMVDAKNSILAFMKVELWVIMNDNKKHQLRIPETETDEKGFATIDQDGDGDIFHTPDSSVSIKYDDIQYIIIKLIPQAESKDTSIVVECEQTTIKRGYSAIFPVLPVKSETAIIKNVNVTGLTSVYEELFLIGKQSALVVILGASAEELNTFNFCQNPNFNVNLETEKQLAKLDMLFKRFVKDGGNLSDILNDIILKGGTVSNYIGDIASSSVFTTVDIQNEITEMSQIINAAFEGVVSGTMTQDDLSSVLNALSKSIQNNATATDLDEDFYDASYPFYNASNLFYDASNPFYDASEIFGECS